MAREAAAELVDQALDEAARHENVTRKRLGLVEISKADLYADCELMADPELAGLIAIAQGRS